ncbi:hypothetical protein [Legionella brunensis]|uniref:Uncharacterized protein n=1 Tax=Legionella brunensis TaxID=29422 RepID=A0A0W0S489_9GAMM|nr:hypothetical protein [Legionella brunensis]KTC77869.1 hypothetical protein Lbru_2762 [Legionella brunensis]
MLTLKHISIITLLFWPFQSALADSYMDSLATVMKQCYSKEKKINGSLAECISNTMDKYPNPKGYQLLLRAESETSDQMLLTVFNPQVRIKCLVTVGETLEIKICDQE